jgi:hypothetical protein
MKKTSINYQFHNNLPNKITFIVEPWAEEFAIPPNSTLNLSIYCDQIGLMETSVSKDYFTIWLWAGCRAEVALDGKDQTPPSLAIPAPG